MEKQEIVKVLQEIQSIYTKALSIKDFNGLIQYCIVNKIQHGFCYHFEYFDYKEEIRYNSFEILTQLSTDREIIDCYGAYWYDPVRDHIKIKKALENAIYPRIENLYRTIARLQNEIQHTQQ